MMQTLRFVFKRIDKSKVPVLNERDITEKFISGTGPGGQCVNKSVNCCQLKHEPTGIVVKVHHTRSLDQNRKIARELLLTKLDNLINGQNSIENQKKEIKMNNEARKKDYRAKVRAMKMKWIA